MIEIATGVHGGFCAFERRQWLMLGIPRTRLRRPYRLSTLAELAAADISAVAVIDPSMRPLFNRSQGPLLALARPPAASAIFLLPWIPPPPLVMREDSRVTSFVCSAAVFRSLLELRPERAPHRLCFVLLDSILSGKLSVDRLLIRQLPLPAQARSESLSPPIAVVLPHRGELRHLETALYFLKRTEADLRVRVGLDEEDTSAYAPLAARYPTVEFFGLRPAPGGPYVIRQKLAARSREPMLAFHDSDDVSCADRFSTQADEIERQGCELVGSHELRFDEVNKQAVAYRYPLDASEAMRDYAHHTLLHPASMVTRRGFFAAGGLSTDQKIANDTQFLWRAAFRLRIRNADAFLYIRRKHPQALTVAPATAIGIPLRRRLAEMWRADFQAVSQGKISLEESSLSPKNGSTRHRLFALKLTP